MASGSIVGEGDGAKEKQRFAESKVYTRKAYKGGLKKKNKGTVTEATAAKRDRDDNSTQRLAPAAAEAEAVAEAVAEAEAEAVAEAVAVAVEGAPPHATQPPAPAASATQPPVPAPRNVNSTQLSAPEGDNSTRPPPASAAPPPPEDGNSTQQQQEQVPEQPVSTVEAPSVDSSSLNRQEPPALPPLAPSSQDTQPPAENGVAKAGPEENRVKINFGSRSKQDVRELRRKLESELDMVRGLVKKIETKQGQIGGLSYSNVSGNDGVNNNLVVGKLRRVHSEVASGGVVSREITRPLHQLSISVLENSQGGSEKEKRTPKANQFYQSSEFLLAKDKFPPAESNKKTKFNLKKHGGGEHKSAMGTKFFKSCSSLLEKLMKHKHGWVFNEPVDAAKMGLHDYHIIIRHPMDLGTIKSRLNKNWYKSPREFAEDVRLTFANAMTYNPPGQDVHVMAEVLLKIFEERWAIIESDYNRQVRYGFDDYGTGLHTPTPRKALPPPPLDMARILERSESMTHHGDPRPKLTTPTPTSRTPAPKKPKARDPNKRDMTYDEKQKLSTSLQVLPSDKIDTLIQIIKRRNSAVFQGDEEIEVDIDSVDTETLWELDRYVTNYKKSLSKHKRKAELAVQARAETVQNNQPPAQVPNAEEVPMETATDAKIVSSSAPVEIVDNQGDNRSRSSSSSSSSSSGSSSSDSDSDSSSESGSDSGSPKT